ncbi:glycosyltransferase family 2 protein [bacterium]|nr:glycosyltransferase family 2 protein [bacterium]
MRSLIIIPTYNSQSTIKELLNRTLAIKPKTDILVVNDGSADRTLDFVKEFKVNIIDIKKNMGKGYALRKGFEFFLSRENHDFVCTLDADLQHPPELIRKFEQEIQDSNCDMIIGDRMKSIAKMPLHRIGSNFMSSFSISLVTGRRVNDSQCGFRLIKRELIEKLRLKTIHFDTESEIIIEAVKTGAAIKFVEIPTIYIKSNISAYDNFTDTMRFINLIGRYLFTRNHNE